VTASASTSSRPEVLVDLGAGLAGAGRAELEELADQFGSFPVRCHRFVNRLVRVK
jgi:hypothetical protein